MIEYALYSLGLALALYVATAPNHKDAKVSDFIINSYVAIIFANSHVRPSYDKNMPLFQILAFGVVGIGGMVGGVVGALLPRISSGISAGFLCGVFICAILFPMDNAMKSTFYVSGPIFLGLLALWSYMAQAYNGATLFFRIALGSSFLFVMSLDGFAQTGLNDTVGNLIRMESASLSCQSDCAVQFLLITWVCLSVLVSIIQGYRRDFFKSFLNRFSCTNPHRQLKPPDRLGYRGLTPTNPPAASVSQKQKTFSYPDTLVTNFYDPDRPPAYVQTFAVIVIPIIQRVAYLHGFQVDNSRNQAEHIIMLLSNDTKPTDNGMFGACSRLHDRLFENYKKWCDRMGSPPLFCLRHNGAIHLAYLEDIVVFFLIWGEAANLRHCPESLCFLYHKVMEEHLVLVATFGTSANTSTMESSRYPGYFLDMVVTPLYDVIASGMKKGHDHHERKTYDDFNEFFWSPSCLKYSIHDDDYPISTESVPQYQSLGIYTEERETSIHVSVGLQSASKTYIEKRSWLHPLFSLRRIFEWHVVTFTLLATWAFSTQLQWSYAFTLQVGSFVFLEISFMNMIWTSLEVWTVYPNTSIPLSSVYGYLIRLVAGYLVLVYQATYYHWSFAMDTLSNGQNTTSIEDTAKDAHGEEPMFWWWQYTWLSLISLSFYLLQSILCWYPATISYVLSCNDDLVQAFLNICYPFSQLYVGKVVHAKQSQVMWYIAFWLPLILFKLWFGYRYVVHPVTIPSVELYDDYMNFQKISFFKTSALMFLWWFPHFLVYIIDLSIWYSVWISVAGGFVALSERQGAVRDSRSFRHHFIRSPLAFSQRLLDENSAVYQGSSGISASTASLTQLQLISNEQSNTNNANVSYQSGSVVEAKKPKQATFGSRAMSTANLLSMSSMANNFNDRGVETERLVYENNPMNNHVKLPHAAISDSQTSHETGIASVNEAMTELHSQINNQRWILFARVWNEIIVKLRNGDHISNIEKDRMSFSTFSWLTKPIYLPTFQTAGCVVSVIHSYRETNAEYVAESEPEKKIAIIEKFSQSLDVTATEAVSEAWELSCWIITRILGVSHQRDMEAIINKLNLLKRQNNIFGNVNTDSITNIMTNVINIVNILKNNIQKRKSSLLVTPEILRKEEETRSALGVATGSNTSPRADMKASSASTAGKIKKSVSSGFLQGLDMQQSGQKKSSDVNKFAKLQPFRQSTFVLSDILRDKLREELRGLFQGIKSSMIVQDTISSHASGWMKEDVGKLTFIQSFESGFFWNDIYASQQLDDIAQDHRCHEIVLKLHDLLTLRQADADPSSPEAIRRLNFFINSLFMQMPTPPPIKLAHEYTCMTPYYSEDVLLSRQDLEAKNSDGISTLLYLQTLYNRDWQNFLERQKIKEEALIWSKEHSQETRMWASLRSQTLFRTVEGMMASEAAVKLLAEIEQLDNDEASILGQLKFQYVVACQVYGQMKKNLEPKADDIEYLLMRHPNLRVAYIDSIRSNRSTEDGMNVIDTSYYSVLIKYDPTDKKIKEVFRLKLPGNPVLGEGKPENQNHAIVFSRGRYLQAIDMNQEGYFEESLKMRNLLQEFDNSGCTILGFREHIFTGSVSSVANYMALQELSFVSLGQRVLNNPLFIRQHYGHPDFFDKLFVMTEGGMSKASKGINLSEDVFAGFNATIRGHTINFKEYAHVGKGRDVGLQQTYKFEAKLSQGNAEQSISRDIDRICDRLDFFRLFSFYYGGIGHYLANTLVMFTLVVVVYTMLGLAVFDEEGVNGRGIAIEGIFQMILAGMGVLQTFPLAVTLTVEKGLVTAFGELVYMMLSGGPFYFIFHIQTKCYYFQQTLLAGGATYRPTGRGFVIRHSPFDENYRFFATSHLYIGFELAVNLILLALYTKSKQYVGLTWSLWMASASFLLGPFWFNPVTFEWDKVVEDYFMWMRWMTETGGGSSEQSWESWWKEDNAFFKKLTLSWKILLILEKCGPWTVIAIGLFGFKFWRSTSDQQMLLEVLGLYITYFFGNWVIAQQERRLSYAVRRFASLCLSTALFVITVYLFCMHTVYLRYTVAIYYFGASLSFISLLFIGVHSSPVSYAYKLHDYLVGHILFGVIGLMTILQTWLLYHNALSHGVVNEDILKYAKKTKEKALDEKEVLLSLEKKLAEQEKKILSLLSDHHSNSDNNGIEMREKTSLLSSNNASSTGTKKSYGSTSDSLNPIVNITVAPEISTTVSSISQASKRESPSRPVNRPPHAPIITQPAATPIAMNQVPTSHKPAVTPTLSTIAESPINKSSIDSSPVSSMKETNHVDAKPKVGSLQESKGASFMSSTVPPSGPITPSGSLPVISKSNSHVSNSISNVSWDSSTRTTHLSPPRSAKASTDFVFKQPDQFPKRDS